MGTNRNQPTAFVDRLRLPGLVSLTAVIPRVYWSTLPHPSTLLNHLTSFGILIPTHCEVRSVKPTFRVAFFPAGGPTSVHTLRIMAEVHRYTPKFDPFPLLPLLLPNHRTFGVSPDWCVCPHTFLEPLGKCLFDCVSEFFDCFLGLWNTITVVVVLCDFFCFSNKQQK